MIFAHYEEEEENNTKRYSANKQLIITAFLGKQILKTNPNSTSQREHCHTDNSDLEKEKEKEYQKSEVKET